MPQPSTAKLLIPFSLTCPDNLAILRACRPEEVSINLKTPRPTTKPLGVRASDASWRTRLRPLSEVRLQELRVQWKGLSRADPATLNDAMAAAFSTQDTVCRLAAWVRCKLLSLPVGLYTPLVSVSENSVRRLVSITKPEGAGTEKDLFWAFGKAWLDLSKSTDRESLATELRQAREEFLDCIPGVHQGSTFGLLNRYRYQLGSADLFKNLGIKPTTYLARNATNSVFTFSELHEILLECCRIEESDAFLLRSDDSRFKLLVSAWLADGEALLRPPSICRIHAYLSFAGVDCSGASFLSDSGFQPPERTSRRVSTFKVISEEQFAPIRSFLESSTLFSPGDLSVLAEEIRLDSAEFEKGFEFQLRLRCKEKEITNRHLADAVDLGRVPGGATYVVRSGIRFGEYSPTCPPGVLAVLLSRSLEDLSMLLRHKRTEIRRDLIRVKSALTTPIHIERIVWGIEAAELKIEQAALARIERGQGRDHSLEEELLLQVLSLGLEKGRAALARWSSLRSGVDISSIMRAALYQFGRPRVAELAGVDSVFINRLAAKRGIPGLPVTKELITPLWGEWSDEMEKSWYREYPTVLAERYLNPVLRLVLTFIAATSASPKEFFKTRGHDSQHVTRLLRVLKHGDTLTSEQLSILSRRLFLKESDPFFVLLHTTNLVGNSKIAFHVARHKFRAARLFGLITDTVRCQQVMRGDLEMAAALSDGRFSLPSLLAGRVPPLSDENGELPFSNLAGPTRLPAANYALKALETLPGLKPDDWLSNPRDLLNEITAGSTHVNKTIDTEWLALELEGEAAAVTSDREIAAGAAELIALNDGRRVTTATERNLTIWSDHLGLGEVLRRYPSIKIDVMKCRTPSDGAEDTFLRRVNEVRTRTTRLLNARDAVEWRIREVSE